MVISTNAPERPIRSATGPDIGPPNSPPTGPIACGNKKMGLIKKGVGLEGVGLVLA